MIKKNLVKFSLIFAFSNFEKKKIIRFLLLALFTGARDRENQPTVILMNKSSKCQLKLI